MKNILLNQKFMKEVYNIRMEASDKIKQVIEKEFSGCLFMSNVTEHLPSYVNDKAYFNKVFKGFNVNGGIDYTHLFQLTYSGATYLDIVDKEVVGDNFVTEHLSFIKDGIIYQLDFNKLTLSYISNKEYSDLNDKYFKEVPEAVKLLNKYLGDLK